MDTLRYVVLVNGLLAILSIAYYVLLRRETFFGANRLMLWLIIVASFTWPLLELPDWRPQPVRDVMQRTARAVVPKVLPNRVTPQPDVTITFPNGKTYPAVKSAWTPTRWSWQQVLVIVYVLVVLGLLIRFIVQILSLCKLIQRSVQERYDDFTVVRNESISSPFSFFNQVFINPLQHMPDELEQILRHERVHVQARHSLDMLGAELVCIVLWFNPAAYLFRHLLHQTLEFSADRAVLAEGVDARAYQYNLLKVSLAQGGSVITNHFSKSQLKSRIVMLNKRQSPVTHWLKYPILIFTALTVVSTFARPQLNTLEKYLPNQVRKADFVVAEMPEKIIPLVAVQELAVVTKEEIRKNGVVEMPIKQVAQVVDSTSKQQPVADSVRLSPSRYMVYQNNYLYWIITPKTTFDDFAVMKQEFAKHGHVMQLHVMQLNEIKYDPLYTFIDRIVITVQRSMGGMTKVNELESDNKPIPTVAGFVGIGSKAGGSGTGGLSNYGNDFPEILRSVARDEENEITNFIKKHRIDYLMQESKDKFSQFGSGAATYPKLFFSNKSTKSSGLIVNPDGSLSVNEELGAIRVFVNNEPATLEAVRSLTLDKLYAVVKKTQFNPASKQSFTSALLIYTTIDN